MRWPTRRSSDAWGNGRTGAECLAVDAIRRDTPRCKAGSQIAHESRRSANVEVAIERQITFPEHSHIQAPRRVKIDVGPILGVGRAVANVAVVMSKRCKQSTRFLSKGMFAAVPGSVQPPDFSCR